MPWIVHLLTAALQGTVCTHTNTHTVNATSGWHPYRDVQPQIHAHPLAVHVCTQSMYTVLTIPKGTSIL